MNRFLWHTVFSLICYTTFGQQQQPPQSQQTSETHSTGLVPDQDDGLLMFSTIDGSLIAVEQRTGQIRWHQRDEPAVKVPQDTSQPATPIFLPDPKDGSLYLYGPETEALKKLPLTIPQLVATSPCRSSDGKLYTGRKIDTWFNIDTQTGEREQLLGFTKVDNTCPIDSQSAIFVGRTEYNIIMIDTKYKDRKWNVTFYDYSAVKMDPKNLEDYDLVHFTGVSTGKVVTVDRYGKILWHINLGSPVIAVYTIGNGGLISVPFNSVADCTLSSLLKNISLKPSEFKFFPTLYIGEHRHGYYALPSLGDSSTRTVNSKAGQLLLDGPVISQKNDSPFPPFDGTTEESDNDFQRISADTNNIIAIGHYEIPSEYKIHNEPLQITGRSDPVIITKPDVFNSSSESNIVVKDKQLNESYHGNRGWNKYISKHFAASKHWINQQGSVLTPVIIFVLAFLVLHFYHRYKIFKHKTENYEKSSRENSRTDSNSRNGISYEPEDIGEGMVRVGKIVFNADEVLGKGCDGTFVYRGEFDGRQVAVKRLLPGCFTFADREVALLRESDAHAHVVRYFCTEQDRMFRYIALELAEATLQDYVDGRYDRNKISSKKILQQATSGLAHLHSLDIVHRDIKPHNVLLSMPGARGEVRVMISDFGLCKKLQLGRMSFSKRSGVTGTEGWIAPEMLKGERMTCAVDVFSLGCVFYYVLSDGEHPFGDPLVRQNNIKNGDTDLTALKNISENDRQIALVLIKAMIATEPADRPPAQAVYDHPMFWDAAQVLTFFQDVSDRVEKDGPESSALQALEKDNLSIVRMDWRSHIDHEVAADLRKYRSYRGESVRDLLRALRNKKHHYRELTYEAQQSLGEIPTKFTEYWLSRFPKLLVHSWCAMQNFRSEPTLKGYYDSTYEFKMVNEDAEYLQQVEMEATNQQNEENLAPNEQHNEPQIDGGRLSPPRNERKSVPQWRSPEQPGNTINWSPNRVRFRNQRKKRSEQEKKKVEISPHWSLPPAS